MTSPDTPADRAYVAARVAQIDDRLAQAAAEMRADLDAYRDDWSSRHAELLQQHNERVRQIEADHAAWLDRWLDGDPNEGRPTDGQGQVEASAAGSSPASSPGPGPGQHISAAEMLEAEAIKNMSMQEYAALRAEFGIRSPTDMNRLFGDAR